MPQLANYLATANSNFCVLFFTMEKIVALDTNPNRKMACLLIPTPYYKLTASLCKQLHDGTRLFIWKIRMSFYNNKKTCNK